MRIIVSNSSPLILLAKVNAVEILTYFFDRILIPHSVFHEVVEQGLENNRPDAILIQNLINLNRIEIIPKVTSLNPLLKTFEKALHRGELDAIGLALDQPSKEILLDDDEARKLARTLNLHVKGTLGLLIEYRKIGQIDHEKALKLLDMLNKIMYLSGDLYHYVESKL